MPPADQIPTLLLDLFQVVVAIALFVWFMNWPRRPTIRPTIWELQKQRRQELLSHREDDDSPNDGESVNPPAPTPDAASESN